MAENSIVGPGRELIVTLRFVLGVEAHIDGDAYQTFKAIVDNAISCDTINELREALLPMPDGVGTTNDVRLLYAHVMVTRGVRFEFTPLVSHAEFDYLQDIDMPMPLKSRLYMLLDKAVKEHGPQRCKDIAEDLMNEIGLPG